MYLTDVPVTVAGSLVVLDGSGLVSELVASLVLCVSCVLSVMLMVVMTEVVPWVVVCPSATLVLVLAASFVDVVDRVCSCVELDAGVAESSTE